MADNPALLAKIEADYKKQKEAAEFPAKDKLEILKVLTKYFNDAANNPHADLAPANNAPEAMKLIEEMYKFIKNTGKKAKLIQHFMDPDYDQWKKSAKYIFEMHARHDVANAV